MNRFSSLSISLLLLIAGCTEKAVDSLESSFTALQSPAGVGSSEPHLAIGDNDMAVLSWVEPAGSDLDALKFAVLGPDGWSAPSTVAEGANWFINWADFPSVEPIAGDHWAAHWLVRQPTGGLAYDVAIAWSSDAGRTWSKPVKPHRDNAVIDHGFVSLFPTDHAIGVVWLDGRNVTLEESDGSGHAAAHGDMMLQSTTLSFTGELDVEAPIDDMACDCCQTDVAVGAKGPLVVYRDRNEDETRDIYVARLENGTWTMPRSVADDSWVIPGCPVNGPAIAVQGNDVAVAWFTVVGDEKQIRVARSRDGGDSFSAPLVVEAGNVIGRVDIVLTDDLGAVVSYVSATRDKDAEIRIRHISPQDHIADYQLVAKTSSARLSGFPQMVLAGSELVFAWTDPAEPTRVLTATGQLR